jgi:hypothetical protein
MFSGGGKEVTVGCAGHPAFFTNVSVGIQDVGVPQFAVGGGEDRHIDYFLGE